jgi:putative hydrolase of the HAD superfamily
MIFKPGKNLFLLRHQVVWLQMMAVVFDFFRTLVDPEGANPEAYRRTDRLAKVLEIDTSEVLLWWTTTKRDRNISRSPSMKDRVRKLCESIGQPRDDEIIERAIFEADRYHDAAILHPHGEVIEALRKLRKRGLKIGILSNTDEHEIRYLPRSPLISLVDSVALSIDAGLMKPDPEFYRYLLAKLGDIPPSQAIYVGDGENDELLGAKSLGFSRVLFMKQFVAHTGFHSKERLAQFEKQADATLEGMTEIQSFID